MDFPNIKLLQQICFELPITCPQNTLFRNSRMINDLPTQDHSISSIQVSVAGGLFTKKCRVMDLTPDPLGLNLAFKNHSQCFLCTVKLQKPCSMTAFCKVLLGIPWIKSFSRVACASSLNISLEISWVILFFSNTKLFIIPHPDKAVLSRFPHLYLQTN